jgi:hypothetical protein
MFGRFVPRVARDGIEATAEALFPANDYGAPDYEGTDLVRRFLEYLADLPARQRLFIVALFVLVELGAPFAVPGFRRFSRLPVERREQAVRSFRKSPLLPVRIVGDALKATLTLLYMSHADVLAYIGAYSVKEQSKEPALQGAPAEGGAP